MKFRITTLAILFLGIVACCVLINLPSCGVSSTGKNRHNVPEETLEELNKVLRDAPAYRRQKILLLDSLKSMISPDMAREAKIDTYLRIADIYLPFCSDSSMLYAERGVRLCEEAGDDTDRLARSRIALLNSLSTSGLFLAAVELLHTIETMPLTKELKIDTWKAARQLYAYMHSYVSGTTNIYASNTRAQSMAYDDSLINALPADDSFAAFLRGEQFVNQGKFNDARLVLEQLLDTHSDNTRIYGMAAFQLAEVYRFNGDQTEYARLLAKSAMSDIKRSVSEGLALPTLANWLYEQGELGDAFNYINYSLNDAMRGNARMRMVQIAQSMPMIDEAYRHKINASRDELMIYFLLTAFLLIVSGGSLVFLYRQMKRDREIKKKLKHISELQESYIGNFIGLISAYANKVDSLSKLVIRKIASGQTDDLLKMIKAGKFSGSDSDNFEEMFDRVFLDLYPDFVFDFNKLLRPEEQIYIAPKQGLTTELRIYALVRLGIEESTRISQILHYSLNTIYAYRHKMRSKAIDKENFDKLVARIGRQE